MEGGRPDALPQRNCVPSFGTNPVQPRDGVHLDASRALHCAGPMGTQRQKFGPPRLNTGPCG